MQQRVRRTESSHSSSTRPAPAATGAVPVPHAQHPHSAWAALTGGQGRLLAAALAGAMAAFTTMSMVNLAVPGLTRQFHLPQGDVHWVASAFLLAMASAMPAAPCLLQRWGVRIYLGAATLVLMLASVLCAASDSFHGVLLGRVLQGLAAGLMQPVPLLLVQRCVAAPWRGRAAGAMGTGTALTLAFGPLAGGLLIDRLGWQGVFALPLPLGLLSLGLLVFQRRDMTARALEDRHAASTDGLGNQGAAAQRMDWVGLLLASLAITALMQCLSQLALGQGALCALALTVSTLSALGFIARQAELNRPPGGQTVHALVSTALMADRRYRLSCMAALLYGLVLNGFTYLLPLWLHDRLGMAESRMGLVLLVGGLATVLVQPLAATQVDLRAHRPVAGIGFGVLAAALVCLPLISTAAVQWGGGWVLAGASCAAVLCRVGLACAFAALFVPAQRALAPALQAQGATLAQFTQTLGGVLGIGLAALALQWRAGMQGPTAGPGAGIGDVFWLLAGVAAVAAALTWRLRATVPPGQVALRQDTP